MRYDAMKIGFRIFAIGITLLIACVMYTISPSLLPLFAGAIGGVIVANLLEKKIWEMEE